MLYFHFGIFCQLLVTYGLRDSTHLQKIVQDVSVLEQLLKVCQL